MTMPSTPDSPSSDHAPVPAGSGPAEPHRHGMLGMWLFLLSLTILFAASITAYLVVRARADVWPPPEAPPLPGWLWFSTGVILLSSGTIQRGLAAIRSNRLGPLIGAMLITTLLGVIFLASQAACWAWLISIHAPATTTGGTPVPQVGGTLVPQVGGTLVPQEQGTGLFMSTFFLLTGLHALHVIGGLVMLVVVTVRSFGGRYTADDHRGIAYATMYWHFLAVVWLVLFVLIFLIP